MCVVLHESAEAYEREYQQIRGAMIARGTSLNAWLVERGISRQVAYKALKGITHGKKSYEIRKMLLREIAA